MTFAPIVSGRYNTTVLSPSGIPVAVRIALPGVGENAFRVALESVTSQQSYYFLFGDGTVVATNSTGMLTKQPEFPITFGIPTGETHLSIVTGGGAAGFNVTFGSES